LIPRQFVSSRPDRGVGPAIVSARFGQRRLVYARALELAKEVRASMAKTDGATPPEASAKIAAPERVAAFRTGLSAESRAPPF